MMENKYEILNILPSSLNKKYRRLLLYTRISTLAMLNYYGRDGLSYQDIKDALNLKDGSLGPNLSWLKQKEYIRAENTIMDGKKVAVYYIEKEGIKVYSEVKLWLINILDLK